jgi:SpoIID/LytB domain protein
MTRLSRICLRAVVGVAAAGLALSTFGVPTADAAETTIKPLNSTITIVTAGWGHGVGMSQYGAYGAAKAGLNYSKILAFYYPGTKEAKLADNESIRVWIKADTDHALHFKVDSGLTVKDSTGKKKVLPTGSKYKQWRISYSGSSRKLCYKNASGRWVAYSTGLNAKKSWYVYNTSSKVVTVNLPGFSRKYRGETELAWNGGSPITVNTVSMEDYLRGVVPSEMPASWSTEAIKAQAVAARSYAARYKQNLKGKKAYDICNTTSCQVYYGASNEDSRTDAAIKATAGIVLKYQDTIAYTMFSSSNGGHSAKGDYPYLTAHEDPYDDDMLNQYRLYTFTSAEIQKKFPSIGTFKSITLKRDGTGQFGGRVTEAKITGSKGSKTISGGTFKSTFGLRERLALVVGGLGKGTGNYTRWVNAKQVNGNIGVPKASEQAVGSGLHAQFSKGDLYWTKATGSRYLRGSVLAAYKEIKATASDLGWPTSDVRQITDSSMVPGMKTGVYATFAKGMISCPSSTAKTSQCLVSYG